MQQFAYSVLSYQVIDGDSVRVWLDLGFGMTHSCIGRMEGVDTPEKNTEAGKMVKMVVLEWVARREKDLVFWSTDKPKFARRAIGQLYSALQPSETLSVFLINAGIASRYSGAKRPDWGDAELGIIHEKCRQLLATN